MLERCLRPALALQQTRMLAWLAGHSAPVAWGALGAWGHLHTDMHMPEAVASLTLQRKCVSARRFCSIHIFVCSSEHELQIVIVCPRQQYPEGLHWNAQIVTDNTDHGDGENMAPVFMQLDALFAMPTEIDSRRSEKRRWASGSPCGCLPLLVLTLPRCGGSGAARATAIQNSVMEKSASNT